MAEKWWVRFVVGKEMKNGKRGGGGGDGKNEGKTIFTQTKTTEGLLKKVGVWGQGLAMWWRGEGGRERAGGGDDEGHDEG